MLSVIDKATYWAALDAPEVASRLEKTPRAIAAYDLKHVQDAWILSRLATAAGKRILEIGGGYARVLRTLEGNERWNLETIDGPGRLATNAKGHKPPNVTQVRAHLGDFSPELPAGYFDVVFSISVLEHVPLASGAAFWKDHARVMKQGGVGYHAIDFYVGDDTILANETRLDSYIEGIRAAGLDFVSEPAISRPLVFRTAFATNSDLAMRFWNSKSPALVKTRERCQSVSVALEITKT